MAHVTKVTALSPGHVTLFTVCVLGKRAMEGRLRPLGSPRGLDTWDLATYVVLTHPWALAALIVGLPLLRGCGGALVAALRCTERSPAHGLAISAHWSPPAWREALLACGLDPSIASHQRAAMRRVVIALWTWHLLAPSIALLSVALFSDRLPPAYRLGAACVGVRACLHLATTPLLLLTRPAFNQSLPWHLRSYISAAGRRGTRRQPGWRASGERDQGCGQGGRFVGNF